MDSPIISIDTEDIHNVLVEGYGYTHDEAKEIVDGISQSQLNDIAWDMSDSFDMDIYWDALGGALMKELNIKDKNNE